MDVEEESKEAPTEVVHVEVTHDEFEVEEDEVPTILSQML